MLSDLSSIFSLLKGVHEINSLPLEQFRFSYTIQAFPACFLAKEPIGIFSANNENKDRFNHSSMILGVAFLLYITSVTVYVKLELVTQ
jgi:hypothetical protein